jgi:hypothetical protein
MEYCVIAANTTHVLQSAQVTTEQFGKSEVRLRLILQKNIDVLTSNGIIDMTFGVKNPCIVCQIREQVESRRNETPVGSTTSAQHDEEVLAYVRRRNATECAQRTAQVNVGDIMYRPNVGDQEVPISSQTEHPRSQ